MKTRNIILMNLAMFILVITTSIVSAQGNFIFKQNSNSVLDVPVYDNSYSPANAASCFITITNPNGTIIDANSSMTMNVNHALFVLNNSATDTVGDYSSDINCCYLTQCGFSTISYSITPTGTELTSGKSTLYIMVMIIAFILFVICLTIGITVNSKNSKDQLTGYIIAVNNLKYLKIFAWGFAYLLLMLLLYFSWMISFSYLDMDFLSSLFRFAFNSSVVILVPGFILFVYILIANAIRDSKLSDALSNGLRLRE